MPLFPVYLITDAEKGAGVGSVTRAVASWIIIALDDGSKALLIFDSFEKAKQCGVMAKFSVVTIENVHKAVGAIETVKKDGVTHVCWNLRKDDTFDRTNRIDDLLAFYATIPPELKGS